MHCDFVQEVVGVKVGKRGILVCRTTCLKALD
jgi:hypothetical protein